MNVVIGLIGEYGLLIVGVCVVVMFVEVLVWLNEKPLRKSKRFNLSVHVDEQDSMCDWLAPRDTPKSMLDSPLAKQKQDVEK